MNGWTDKWPSEWIKIEKLSLNFAKVTHQSLNEAPVANYKALFHVTDLAVSSKDSLFHVFEIETRFDIYGG